MMPMVEGSSIQLRQQVIHTFNLHKILLFTLWMQFILLYNSIHVHI